MCRNIHYRNTCSSPIRTYVCSKYASFLVRLTLIGLICNGNVHVPMSFFTVTTTLLPLYVQIHVSIFSAALYREHQPTSQCIRQELFQLFNNTPSEMKMRRWIIFTFDYLLLITTGWVWECFENSQLNRYPQVPHNEWVSETALLRQKSTLKLVCN